MNFFGQSKVRRFGISEQSGMIVVQTKKNRVKELCEIPDGNLSVREIRQRFDAFQANNPKVKQLSCRRHDSDVIATTPAGTKVSTIQVENVYNDWLVLNAVAGLGTYEHVANAHELSVLQIARKMFGS